MAVVETRDLTKVFKEGQLGAVNSVNLETREGEFLVFLGPSGSGKTTLLRMIAGLETPTSGEILIGGKVVNDLSPRDRRIAMVFQSYALYPHLSVYKNIAFPLKAQNLKKELHKEKVEWAASLLGIGALLDRKPRELSGGERQRVALARAIVREPAVFLLDEPLSNLDAKLRASAREELERFHRRVATTTIYVTHDQVEAMAMGDRVMVLNKGVVRQLSRLAADEPRRAWRRHRRLPPRALPAGVHGDRFRRSVPFQDRKYRISRLGVDCFRYIDRWKARRQESFLAPLLGAEPSARWHV